MSISEPDNSRKVKRKAFTKNSLFCVQITEEVRKGGEKGGKEGERKLKGDEEKDDTCE